MDEFLHNEDFEQFLKKKTGQHRMYPDDKVWRAISKKLHGDTQWPGLSAISFIVVAALIAGTLIIKPRPDILNTNYHFALQSPGINTSNTVNKYNNVVKENGNAVEEHFSVDRLTNQTLLAVSRVINPETETNSIVENKGVMPDNTTFEASELIAENNSQTEKPTAATELKQGGGLKDISISNGLTLAYNPLQYRFRDPFDKLPKNKKLTLATQWPDYATNEGHHVQIPVIDEVPESIQQTALRKLKKQSSRFDFRFYVTPSVSYRKIHNKDNLQQSEAIKTAAISAPIEANYNIDPNQAINQRPAIGYETGFGLGYKLSKRVAVTSGFQFNISQYNVDAYLYKNEEPASVTLEEDGITSTYTSYSNVRSISGNDAVTFKTRYYQISMPVGVDVTAWSNGKLSLGVGANIQPTYTFDKLPLIISSNFKNYTDGSRFIRNWNFNTGLETYLGYTSGSYRWQIGPQFRYQWLPSLDNKYPNKENLFNYGLKLGLVKYLRQ